MLRMIYPADRFVSEAQIRNWLADAIHNDEVDLIGDQPIITLGEVATIDIYDAMKILEETGKFTFSM